MFSWVVELRKAAHQVRQRLTVIQAGVEYLHEDKEKLDPREMKEVLSDMVDSIEPMCEDLRKINFIADEIAAQDQLQHLQLIALLP